MSGANGHAMTKSGGALPIAALSYPLERRTQRREVDEEELRAWLLDACDPSHGKQRCLFFVLFHVTGVDDKPCSTAAPIADRCPDAEREAAVGKIVSKFVSASRNVADAQTSGGLAHFYVNSYRTDKEGERARDQHHFLVEPDSDVSTLGAAAHGGDSDAAAALGHIQRLSDTVIRTTASQNQATCDRYSEEVRHKNELIDRLMTQRIDDQVRLQDALDRSAQRQVETQHQLMRLEAEYKAIHALIDYALPLGLKIIAEKTGHKIPTPAAAGDAHPLEAFARTLTPRQLAAFVATLDEKQQQDFRPLAEMLVRAFPEADKRKFVEAMAEQSAPQQLEPAKPEGGSRP